MSDAPKESRIAYQYFWVKIASKQEVDRQRRESLTQEHSLYLEPTTLGVFPPPLRTVMALAEHKLSVDIGVRIDMKEVEKHNMYISVHVLDGYDKKRAEEWIGTEFGRAWAGNAFCFLCHASVEFH
jgi:hypothetical protein